VWHSPAKAGMGRDDDSVAQIRERIAAGGETRRRITALMLSVSILDE